MSADFDVEAYYANLAQQKTATSPKINGSIKAEAVKTKSAFTNGNGKRNSHDSFSEEPEVSVKKLKPEAVVDSEDAVTIDPKTETASERMVSGRSITTLLLRVLSIACFTVGGVMLSLEIVRAHEDIYYPQMVSSVWSYRRRLFTG